MLVGNSGNLNLIRVLAASAIKLITTPSKAIPHSYQRVMLINPTRDLAQLLIAGDLIQKYQQDCQTRKIVFLLVLDESFKELIQGLIPESCLLFYPGEQLDSVGPITRLRTYYSNLRQLKKFKADIAFTIEDDALSLRLLRSSGAKFKLAYSHNSSDITGVDLVISSNTGSQLKSEKLKPNQLTPKQLKPKQLKPKQKHRWNDYYSVFSVLGLAEPKCQYMALAPKLLTTKMQDVLASQGVDFNFPIIVLHPGASNDSDKWPLLNFVTLSLALLKNGYQPVFIGNGQQDRSANNAIMNVLDKQEAPGKAVNLIDCFTLSELASFLILSTAIVANNSGHFHLASALGIPGCIILTPAQVATWRPLSRDSHVMAARENCDARCNNEQCVLDYRCLISIKPDDVFDKLSMLTVN